MIEVGSKAPAFALLDTKREVRSLDQFTGKTTLLVFYPGAFTGVCEKEMCSIRDTMAELNNLDVNVVGISVDSPFANGAFASRNNLEFPLLSDYKRETAVAYGILFDNFAGMEGYTVGNRSVFLLDADGIVRWSWVAENPGIEPDYSAIKQQLTAIG
jgi:glutaredoxin-dependent peroxiredoxin